MFSKKPSFRLKLLLGIEVLVFFSLTLVGFFAWAQLESKVREISRAQLSSIASVAAGLVDTEKHERIQTQDDAGGNDYQEITALFDKIKSSGSDIDGIYTLRKTERENIFSFVASDSMEEDTEDSEETIPFVGEEYDASLLPRMQEGFEKATADDKINCDKWGCWLSGYAPLKNDRGETVAIVGVDTEASQIRSFERKAVWFFASVYFLFLIVIPLVLYFTINRMLRPLSTINQGMRKFHRDLSSRIDIKTGDEFESIARTFNNMARKIQTLYSSLEDKVREKTSELALRMKEIEEDKVKDEALMICIGDGLIATNKNGKINMVNASAERMLGVPKNKIIGTACSKFPVEDEKGELLSKEKRPIYLALKEKRNVSGTYYFLKSQFEKVPFAVTAAPIFLKRKVVGATMVFRDISKEKQIEKAKTEFVSLASHQLKNPLANINWQIEALLDGDICPMPSEQKKYLKKVERSSKQMVALVNALLNISRIEMGTYIINSKPLDLKKLLDGVIDELRLMIKNKGTEISKNIEEKMPRLNLDPNLMRIIFQNLLSNAVKYTDQGGKVNVKIGIKKSPKAKDQSKIVIEVSDNGYGIPENQQEKIFSKLFRASNARKMVAEGNGLGLYIVKSIVDSSGGKIEFKSKVGEGTTFKVSFPKKGMVDKKGTKVLN